jgi:hypothetical protein
MIYQTDAALLPDMQHYACRFLFLARAREVLVGKPWTATELNLAWIEAKDKKIISGDLNGDGDFDDPGEDEIKNDVALLELLELPLRVVPVEILGLPLMTDDRGITRVAPTLEPLDPKKYWVGERWIWKIGHFVQGDGTGKAPPLYDSIKGGSLTRKNGKIESLRVYLIKEKV